MLLEDSLSMAISRRFIYHGRYYYTKLEGEPKGCRTDPTENFFTVRLVTRHGLNDVTKSDESSGWKRLPGEGTWWSDGRPTSSLPLAAAKHVPQCQRRQCPASMISHIQYRGVCFAEIFVRSFCPSRRIHRQGGFEPEWTHLRDSQSPIRFLTFEDRSINKAIRSTSVSSAGS